MAGGKSITIAKLYHEMIKRFDKVDKRLDENDRRWKNLFKHNPQLKKGQK